MDFKQLEAFVYVVKLKSFSKAAQRIYLTQPTISAHINNLENELGVTLVNRSGREITLTKQGKNVLPLCSGYASHPLSGSFVRSGQGRRDEWGSGYLFLQYSWTVLSSKAYGGVSPAVS